MTTPLKMTSGPSGTRNTFTQTVNFVTDYGGVSGGSSTVNVTALSAFNTAYAGFTGTTQLIIPPGDYNFGSDNNSWGGAGAPINGGKLTISAYGATLRNQAGFPINNSGLYNDNTHQANIATVSSGAVTVTLLTSTETSRFTSSRYVVVSCVDMQGFGYPPNPAIFEFKKIQSISSGTITFTEPLINSYSSGYPNYNAGSGASIYQGGPGCIYALRDVWDQEIELKGATIPDNGGLYYGKTRVAKYTDCTFATYGPCPTVNVLYQMYRCNCPGFGGLEVDKIVQRAEFLYSSPRAVDFQSASVNELFVLNVSSSSRWRGGGRNNYFYNLSTPDFEFGTMNYGPMGITYMENCSGASGTWMSFNTFPFSDYTEEGGGVLSYAGGPAPPSRAGYWAVPGQNCVLVDTSFGWARSFQVLNVTATGGRTYVTTNLPFPVPSTINGKSSPWLIASHPCFDATLVNCTGNSLFTSQSALPAHTPLFGWTL